MRFIHVSKALVDIPVINEAGHQIGTEQGIQRRGTTYYAYPRLRRGDTLTRRTIRSALTSRGRHELHG